MSKILFRIAILCCVLCIACVLLPEYKIYIFLDKISLNDETITTHYAILLRQLARIICFFFYLLFITLGRISEHYEIKESTKHKEDQLLIEQLGKN